jgi:hypothetical protein
MLWADEEEQGLPDDPNRIGSGVALRIIGSRNKGNTSFCVFPVAHETVYKRHHAKIHHSG